MVDFILLRQMLAAGKEWNAELEEAISPVIHENK